MIAKFRHFMLVSSFTFVFFLSAATNIPTTDIADDSTERKSIIGEGTNGLIIGDDISGL